GPEADAAAATAVADAIRSAGTVDPAAEFERPPDGFILAQVFAAAVQGNGTRRIRAQIATADPESRMRARSTIERSLRALERPGLTMRVEYDEVAIAGVTNDSALTARANSSIRRLLGEDAVVHTEGAPAAFSEDFGSFQAE